MPLYRKMQNNAVQQYVPGGSVTTANAGGYGFAPTDLTSLLAARLAPKPAGMLTARSAPTRLVPPAASAPEHGGPSEAEQWENRARIAQAQAALNPQPLRMVGGAGITPGYMPDVNAMNAFQRKLYLPQDSKNDPSADAYAERMRAATDSDQFEEFRKASQRRTERARTY